MTNTEKVSIAFSIKDDQFTKSLKDINTQLKLTKSDLGIASESLKTFGNNTRDLSTKSKVLEQNIKTLNEKMRLYQDNVSKNTIKLADNKKQLELLSVEKDKANKKYKEAVDLYGKESEEAAKANKELELAKEKYKEKENQINNNIKAINKHNTELNNTEAELVKVRGELDKTNKALAENQNGFLIASKSLENAKDKFQNAGKGISSVGDGLIKLTAPMATAGVAMAVMSANFEESLAKVSTLLDGNTKDLERYKDAIIKLSNNTGKDVNELSASLYEALSAGVEASDAIRFLEEANKLATGGFTENAKAVDVLTTVLNAYGLEVEETSKINDVLIQTQNKGKITVDQLAGVLGRVVPTAKAAGVGIEQLGASYAIMTSKGISAEESTTYLNSLLNEMSKSGTKSSDALKELTGKGFADLIKEGKTVGDVLDLLNKYAEENGLAMNDMFGSAEAAKAGMVLVEGEGEAFNNMLIEMQNSVGSADEAFKKMDDTTKNSLAKSINQLKNSFLEAGEKLAPIINLLSEGIDEVSEAIGKMDAKTLASVAKFAMLSVGIGGVTKVTGGFVGAIGTICGGLSKVAGFLGSTTTATSALGTATATVAKGGVATLAGGLGGLSGIIAPVGIALAGIGATAFTVHEYFDAMNNTVTKTSEDMSFLEKAFMEVNGQTVRSKEELEKMNIIYKEFDESIAPATVEALENVAKQTRELQLSIETVNFDGVITEYELSSVKTKTQQWADNIIQTIKENNPNIQTEIESLFNLDGNFSENEKRISEFVGGMVDSDIAEVQRLADENIKIMTKAQEEGRANTALEISKMDANLKKGADLMFKNSLLSNDQILKANETFLNQMNIQNVDGMQQAIKTSQEAKDEEIKVINEKYTSIDDLKKAYKEANDGGLKAQIKAEIDTLEQQKQLEIEQAKDKHEQLLKLAEERYSGEMEQINKYTGELFTTDDYITQEQLAKMKQRYTGLQTATEDGMQRIYDTSSGQWKNVLVDVDENTGEILGVYDGYTGEVAGYSKDIERTLKKQGDAWYQNKIALENSLNGMKTATVTENGTIVDELGNTIGTIEDLETEIKNISGKEIKVETNADGTIKNLEDIQRAISGIDTTTKYVKVVTEYVTKGGNGISQYATGTSGTNEGGLAITQEKGWELVDNISSASARAIQDLDGELSYLPSNTKVSTHLASTAKMNAEINKQVNNQLNFAMEQAIKKMGKELEKQLKGTDNNDVSITINQTLNEVKDGKQVALDLTKEIKKEMAKFGIKR